MTKTCEQHVDQDPVFDTIGFCGRPAKFITPEDTGLNRSRPVCGIHRRSVDAFYKRIGSDKRCEPIAALAAGKCIL